MQWQNDEQGIISCPLAAWALLRMSGQVLLALDFYRDEKAFDENRPERLQLVLNTPQAIQLGQALLDAGTRPPTAQKFGHA